MLSDLYFLDIRQTHSTWHEKTLRVPIYMRFSQPLFDFNILLILKRLSNSRNCNKTAIFRTREHILVPIYSSKLCSFKRKSYMLIVRIPSLSCNGFTTSFTIIIFLNESFTFIREAFSCALFSASGRLKADWM